jgi:hypothetical protein
MTTNQTIDGVPRELLENAARCIERYQFGTDWARRLRALLDAKPETVAGHHPACRAVDDYNPGECSHSCKPAAQRKIDPVVSGWQLDSFDEKLDGADPTDTSTLSNHDVAQLVCAVRTLQARQMTEPAAQPQGDSTRWERLYHQASADLCKIGEALGVDEDDQCLPDILEAIADLKSKPQGEPVAMSRDQFEAWVLGREHPTYGWLDKHWLTRGDNPDTYATEYVQGLWVASQTLYAEQPAPVAVELADRSPENYAIEHAEYMAKSADGVLAKYQAYGLALLAVDEGGDDGEGELFESIDSARGDLQESLVDLRSMVYEFRKRSAKT